MTPVPIRWPGSSLAWHDLAGLSLACHSCARLEWKTAGVAQGDVPKLSRVAVSGNRGNRANERSGKDPRPGRSE